MGEPTGDILVRGGNFGYEGHDTGLVDPEKAEVHFVIRSHSKTQKRKVTEQLTTFDGGCRGDDVSGIPNRKGQCADILFGIFQPD